MGGSEREALGEGPWVIGTALGTGFGRVVLATLPSLCAFQAGALHRYSLSRGSAALQGEFYHIDLHLGFHPNRFQFWSLT